MRKLAYAIVLVGGAAATAAPPKADESGPAPVWSFRVTPAGESNPALRWRLLPELRDQHAGDAAATYLRAMSPEMIGALQAEDLQKLIADSTYWPIAELRTDKAKRLRQATSSRALTEADYAARCDSCDWHLHQRQREEGLSLMLPELQSMRTLSRGLSARTRIALADGDFSAASRSLQSQFAAARHVGRDSSNLIQALIGVAIASSAARDVADWIEAPGSPNLYWALSAMPKPFVSMRRGMEGERIFLDKIFPGHRDALQNKTAPPLVDFQKVMAEINAMGGAPGAGSQAGVFDSLAGGLMIAAQAETARKHLLAAGWKESTVKSLPATSAVILREIALYDEHLDAGLKWLALSPADAIAGLVAADAKFKKDVTASHGSIIAKLLLPAVHMAYYAEVRLDRQLAGLRAVEAIRMHAAATGKLPAAAAEIKVVPWPIDPLTGKPFEIKQEGDSVSVEAAPPAGRTSAHSGFKFVVSLAKQ